MPLPMPTLTTSDGLRLSGRRRMTVAAPRAAVVIVHGFTASSNCPNVEALADEIHGLDVDVLTYDARGHGGSDGESTLGDAEQHDVAAAVLLARQRAEHVVLVGASMGAVAALRYAVTDDELAGVVAVSCPAEWKLPRNMRGVLAAAMTRTPIGRRVVGQLSGVRIARRWTNAQPPLTLAPQLRVPVAFVHGRSDKFIDVRDAALLFDAAPEPKQLAIVAEMGHAFGAAAVDRICTAVTWALDARVAAVPN